jgi:hypothetical protein
VGRLAAYAPEAEATESAPSLSVVEQAAARQRRKPGQPRALRKLNRGPMLSKQTTRRKDKKLIKAKKEKKRNQASQIK